MSPSCSGATSRAGATSEGAALVVVLVRRRRVCRARPRKKKHFQVASAPGFAGFALVRARGRALCISSCLTLAICRAGCLRLRCTHATGCGHNPRVALLDAAINGADWRDIFRRAGVARPRAPPREAGRGVRCAAVRGPSFPARVPRRLAPPAAARDDARRHALPRVVASRGRGAVARRRRCR